MSPEQSAAQTRDLGPWHDLMAWLPSTGLSPECIRELVESRLDLAEGIFNPHLTRRAAKWWPGAEVYEYPTGYVLERDDTDTVLGRTFREALNAVNALCDAERARRKDGAK